MDFIGHMTPHTRGGGELSVLEKLKFEKLLDHFQSLKNIFKNVL